MHISASASFKLHAYNRSISSGFSVWSQLHEITFQMCKEETTVKLSSLKMALMDATTQSEN